MCYSLRIDERKEAICLLGNKKILQLCDVNMPANRKNKAKGGAQRNNVLRVYDNKSGAPFGKDTHLQGPFENGMIFLQSGVHEETLALLKPTYHPAFDFYYEITCPKPPLHLCNVDDATTAEDQELQQSKTDCSSNSSSRSLQSQNHNPVSDDLSEWYPWGTIHKVPHTLEYEMTLHPPRMTRGLNGRVILPSRTSNVKESASNTLYTLRYCGAVMGPTQMRIDKSDSKAAVLMTEKDSLPKQKRGEPKLKSSWDMVVGPGVDPSLMICFAAVVNNGRAYGPYHRS